jgi:hypothetical protein
MTHDLELAAFPSPPLRQMHNIASRADFSNPGKSKAHLAECRGVETEGRGRIPHGSNGSIITSPIEKSAD